MHPVQVPRWPSNLTPGPKNVVLFSEIGQVKIFLSHTLPHSQMCIIIYIFNLKKQTNKHKNTRLQKKQKKLKKGIEYLRKID